MEVAEARQVPEAGRTSTGYRLWQQVVDLLEPVHRTQLLTGHEQGEAAVLVGRAKVWLRAWDKAGPFLGEAVQDGNGEVALCDRILGDRDAARMGLRIAERDADADLRAKIGKLRAAMDQEVEAAALVAELLAS
jgi:hypothetical protein